MPTLAQLPPLAIPDEDWDKKPALGPEGLRHGTLPNGMRYFVLGLKKPKDRCALALAVDAGSVLEGDAEQGAAHILEHLAFNATERFESHEIVRFLESIGAQFGACTNAYTSADETVYELLVPTDAETYLAEALAVFAQFAAHIRCAEGDLAKERGAVLEELRLGRGAAGRTQEAHWKLILQGSKYADRLPIGIKAIIEQMPASVVQGFYRRWYHPERMAVVAVGDFPDPGRVVTLIRETLGPVRPTHGVAPGVRPQIGLEPHAAPRARATADKEAQKASVSVSWQQPAYCVSTHAEYRRNVAEELFHMALSNRYYRLSRKPRPPFFSAQAGGSPLCRAVQSQVVTAACSPTPTALLEALEVLLLEVARVRLHGLSARELGAVKASFLATCENMWVERDQMEAVGVRAEYVRHFLTGEMVIGQAAEARMGRAILEHVAAADVAAVARGWRSHRSCVVKAVSHQRLVSEAQLLGVLAKVDALEAAGAIPAGAPEGDLPDLAPPGLGPPGAIVARRELPTFGATQLTLSNGMTVAYKCTDFLDDQVLVSGYAHGGHSEVPRAQHVSALFAASIAQEIGHCGLKPEVLHEALMGLRVDLGVAMDAYSRTLGGECSPADLEAALQLLHRGFTSPLAPVPEELATCLEVARENIRAQLRSPTQKLTRRLNQVLYANCYYYRPLTLRDVDEHLDIHAACAHFRGGFANPAAFTLTLVGALQAAELEGLVERYLASIPVPGDAPAPLSIHALTPLPYSVPQPLPHTETVWAHMLDPCAQAAINFPVSFPLDDPLEGVKESLRILYLCQLLETKLLQKLRFEHGGVYTLSVRLSLAAQSPSEAQMARGYIGVAFACHEANAARLVALTLAEIDRLQREGVGQGEADTLLVLDQRQWESAQQDNGFHADMLLSSYRGRLYSRTQDVDGVFQLRIAARAAVRAELGEAASLRESLCRILPRPVHERHIAITLLPKQSLSGWLARRLGLAGTPERRAALWWVLGGTAAAALAAVAAVYGLRRRRLGAL